MTTTTDAAAKPAGDGRRSFFSGEFRDRALEARYRRATADSHLRQTLQFGVLVLLASGPMLTADYFLAAGAPEIGPVTVARACATILPAIWIVAALRKAHYALLDKLTFAYVFYVICDSALMIHVFSEDVLPMAARLPLFVMIANVMLLLPIGYRAAMNLIAFPVFAGSFWVLTPLPVSTTMNMTAILAIAFVFGFAGGTWMTRLRRAEYHRSEQLQGANQALQRSHRDLQHANNSKSAFLSNVSHELRTPLNAILGFSDVLDRQLFGPLGNEKYQGYVRDIRHSGQHLLELINDILDLNKLEAGKMDMNPEWIDLSAEASEWVKQLRSAHGLDPDAIEVAGLEGLEVHADRRAFQQIFINLMSNAVKYAGTVIPVRLAGSQGADGRLVVSVEDGGPGIPEERIEALMRPFEQADSGVARKAEGWGLGLPLAAALARENGAELKLENRSGGGVRALVAVAPERVRPSQARLSA